MADDLRCWLEAQGFDLRTQLEALANYARDTTYGESFVRLPRIGTISMIELLDAFLAGLEPPESEPDLGEQMRHRKLGVYRLHWKSGGSSVAAVGMLYDGARWYAPADWTTGSVDADRANVVGMDWSRIERAELIELIEAYRNTTRRYEPEPEDAP